MERIIILLCTWFSLTAGAVFDFGNTQTGIHPVLAPNVVLNYTFTVPAGFVSGELNFASDPNSRGSAEVVAVVACEGIVVADQKVLVNTASSRSVFFPVKADARCGFTLTSRQGQGFGLNLRYKKAATVTVPPKR